MKLPPHSPHKYGFDPKSSPSAPIANIDEGAFSASFDQRLWMFHRSWEPPAGAKVHATLMIVHGTVDHSGAYAELGINWHNKALLFLLWICAVGASVTAKACILTAWIP